MNAKSQRVIMISKEQYEKMVKSYDDAMRKIEMLEKQLREVEYARKYITV